MHQPRLNPTAILSLAVLAVVPGCNDSPKTIDAVKLPADLAASIRDDLATATLATRADVEHALAHAINSGRAVVFVHMDWAPMEPQRDLYSRFVVEYHQRFPDDPLGFHYIDCTPISSDYTPLKSLPGWPGSGREIYARQGNGGCGDLVWINHGAVQHVEMILESEDTAQLIEKTRQFLASAQKDI